MTAFTEAAAQVFSEIGFENLDIRVSDTPIESKEIMVTLGLTGDLHGFFILETTIESARSFLTKMFENLEVHIEEEEFGQMHKEAIAEIMNQIAGRSLMLLSGIKIECDISPPTIFFGSELESSIPVLNKFHRTHVHGNFGKIGLYIGLKTT